MPFAGLDVSVKETSVCIVDDAGRIVREVKVASEPEALLAVLKNPAYHFKRIGLEAGPLSQWLYSALAEADLPVICVETRHMQAVLKAQINKTDRNDAVIAEDTLGDLVLLEQRRPGKADKGRVGQSEAHVARKPSRLRAVRLVRDHDDVVAFAIGVLRIDILVELGDQAEDVGVVFLQQPFEVVSRCGSWRVLAGDAAAGEGPTVIKRKVKFPGTFRRTFSAKNTIE
jgi:Transposase